jgi:hypothetical protein
MRLFLSVAVPHDTLDHRDTGRSCRFQEPDRVPDRALNERCATHVEFRFREAPLEVDNEDCGFFAEADLVLAVRSILLCSFFRHGGDFLRVAGPHDVNPNEEEDGYTA